MHGAPGRTGRAFALADQLEQEIVGAGRPAGTLVGTEEQLIGRYGVGRGVLRQAARLLEDQQVARMRRGRGGGLVVAQPDVRAVSDAVSIYLESIRVSPEEVFDARRTLELFAVQLAADRLDEDHAGLLREALDAERTEHAAPAGGHHRVHAALARATGNPILATFVEALSVLSNDMCALAVRPHGEIVDAVIAGDGVLASQHMFQHLTAMQQDVQRGSGARNHRVEAEAPCAARLLAARIRRDIARLGWPAGRVLGSEAELLERYQVGRATLREATRVLGRHGAVEMRRGPGGGLVIRKPDGTAVRRVTSLHLRQLGMRAGDVFEAREAVEMATLQLAIERLDDGARRWLLDVPLDHAGSPKGTLGETAHGFHIVLAELGGNRTLQLFVAILTGLTAEHLASQAAAVVPGQPREDHRAAIAHAHRRIAEAVLDGDTALARRRMRLHLRALECWPG